MTTTLILPGATSQSVYFKAIDNTTGLAATTVTSATAGLAISYQNTQTGTVTAISLSDLAATNSAWSSGGIKHIAGGVYRLCIPDAAVPATEGARTIIAGTATAFQILGCELVGKPVEVVSGSLVAASVSGAVGSVATGGIAAASIASAAAAKIADVVLRRSWASASASSDGDTLSFRSLLGAVAKLVNKVAVSGSTLTVYKEDDSTPLGTQTVTADAAAEPITAVDTVG